MTWDNPNYKEHSKSCSTCIEIAVLPPAQQHNSIYLIRIIMGISSSTKRCNILN